MKYKFYIDTHKGATFIYILSLLYIYEAFDNTPFQYKPQIIVNLAAQAGVRYSLKNPSAYTSSNLVGFSLFINSLIPDDSS